MLENPHTFLMKTGSKNRVICQIKVNVAVIIVYPVKRTVQNLSTAPIAVHISKISSALAEINGRKIFSLSALNKSIYFSARSWLPFTDNPIFYEDHADRA